MSEPSITIDYLANHLHLADQLARLSWEEWQPIYLDRGQTFEHALKNYRERTNKNRLPLALVALRGDEFVGTVSLKYHDLDTRPDLNPWLGGVFVLPKWRRRGIASMLMQRAVETAAKLNVPELFLWTHSAEGLYLKLGWQVVERMEYCGKNIVVMQIHPKQQTQTPSPFTSH